jgi:hypothetical protein
MDAVFQLYAYCTDVDNDAVWYFDEIVVACSEIQDEPEPEGCACAAGASPALWSLLLLPGVVLRRRRARG